MGDRSPSPPVDRRVSSLRRRSSMGHSVRKSRSIIGLPFEDQIAAIPTTASIEEKLLQIVAKSWATATRYDFNTKIGLIQDFFFRKKSSAIISGLFRV